MPYLVYSHMTYGDAFHSVNETGARFYANAELAGKHSDFPTREEVQLDGYAGGKITMGEYIFKYHTTTEVLNRVLEGAKAMYIGRFSYWMNSWRYTEIAGHPFSILSRHPQYSDWWYARPSHRFEALLQKLHFAGLISMLWPLPRLLFSALLMLFHAPGWFLFSFDYFDTRLVTVAFAGFFIGMGSVFQTILAMLKKGMIHVNADEDNLRRHQTSQIRTSQNKQLAKANRKRRGHEK